MQGQVKPEHQRWLKRVHGYVDTEHYLMRPGPHHDKHGVRHVAHNIAVVVLEDGSAYAGEAKCTVLDVWSRKKGHTMAVGRALKAAALKTPKWCVGRVETHLRGIALRDACREQLVMLGMLDEDRLRDPLARVQRDLNPHNCMRGCVCNVPAGQHCLVCGSG